MDASMPGKCTNDSRMRLFVGAGTNRLPFLFPGFGNQEKNALSPPRALHSPLSSSKPSCCVPN